MENVADAKYQTTTKIDGEIVGVRQLQDHGRLQVPKRIRDELKLKDGDNVYWILDLNKKACIAKACKF